MDEQEREPLKGRPPKRRRAVVLAIGGTALIAILAGIGFAYQTLSESHDLREHPAPGRMVDVGGHRLHLHCTGAGAPTVVLEAGLGNDVNHWSRVQPEVAAFTRVCAYDRAGLGWSDPGPLPRTAQRVVVELAQLLEQAGEPPPYVLAGHSNGGPYARLYAAARPAHVAGLVLVDPNPERALPCEELPGSTRALYGTLVTLAPVGVPRLMMPALFPLEGSALPPERRAVHGALRVRTGALRAVWSERESTCSMLEAVREAEHPAGGLPVAVLSAGERPASPHDVAEHHRAMAQELGTGDFVVVGGSGHWIHLDQPGAVTDAIRRVVVRARERGPGSDS